MRPKYSTFARKCKNSMEYKAVYTQEEVAELLKTDGQDEALAEQLWSELSPNHRENADELSLDELEAEYALDDAA